MTKMDIRKLPFAEIQQALKEMGQAGFRAKQIYEWLWQKGARSFTEMTNLSKDLRLKLEEQFVINAITEDKVQHSSDGTVKTRFRLHDGHLIESVT